MILGNEENAMFWGLRFAAGTESIYRKQKEKSKIPFVSVSFFKWESWRNCLRTQFVPICSCSDSTPFPQGPLWRSFCLYKVPAKETPAKGMWLFRATWGPESLLSCFGESCFPGGAYWWEVRPIHGPSENRVHLPPIPECSLGYETSYSSPDRKVP